MNKQVWKNTALLEDTEIKVSRGNLIQPSFSRVALGAQTDILR